MGPSSVFVSSSTMLHCGLMIYQVKELHRFIYLFIFSINLPKLACYLTAIAHCQNLRRNNSSSCYYHLRSQRALPSVLNQTKCLVAVGCVGSGGRTERDFTSLLNDKNEHTGTQHYLFKLVQLACGARQTLHCKCLCFFFFLSRHG